jgi:Na+/proline symporter
VHMKIVLVFPPTTCVYCILFEAMSDTTGAQVLEPMSTGAVIYIGVLVAGYVCFLLGVAIWSWYGSRGKAPNVDDHFTGGGNLGPVVLVCTLFASVFSGYTTVGIPNETYTKGFLGARWPAMILIIILGSITISSRLREISVERKYNSPVSFIEDRFASKALYRAISLIMAVPMVFYLTAQFAALGNTIVGLSQGAVSAVAGQIVLAVIMLLYETFGGLKGVAITDVLQGCLLLTGTIATCFVLESRYGPFDVAWQRIITTNRPEWKLTPSMDEKINIGSFMASQLAFCIYPHVLMRVVAASSTNILKLSWGSLSVVCWLAQIPSMFLGIYGADPQFLPQEVNPAGFFGAAMDVLLRGSTGSVFTAGLVLIGSLAAIMSTADSAIIAVNNVVTIDIGKKWVWPALKGGVEPTDQQTFMMSKIVSVVTVFLGVLITNLDISLSALFVLQGALLCEATPSYVLGLYHPTIRDSSLVAGMSVGTLVFLFLEFYPGMKAATVIGPGFVGLIINLFVTFSYDYGSKAMGAVDPPRSFDEGKLDNAEICRIMENNKNEPAKNPVLWLCWVLVWFMPPWFFPSAEEAGLTGGVPSWFIYMMLMHGAITGLLVYVIYVWKPNPPNARTAGKEMTTKSLKPSGSTAAEEVHA